MNHDNSSNNNCSSDVDNDDDVITDLYKHCAHHIISSLYHFFAVWISILVSVFGFCIRKWTFREIKFALRNKNYHLVADAVLTHYV